MGIIYSHKEIGYSTTLYTISYTELRDHYTRICSLTDKQFVETLPEIIHLSCAICWFKEISTSVCLCDEGIIHSLAHMSHLGIAQWADKQIIKRIRNQFKRELKLL